MRTSLDFRSAIRIELYLGGQKDKKGRLKNLRESKD